MSGSISYHTIAGRSYFTNIILTFIATVYIPVFFHPNYIIIRIKLCRINYSAFCQKFGLSKHSACA